MVFIYHLLMGTRAVAVLAAVNQAAVNIHEQVFVRTSFFKYFG